MEGGGGGGGQKHFGAFGLLAWGLSRCRFPGSPPCGAAATLSAEAGVSPDLRGSGPRAPGHSGPQGCGIRDQEGPPGDAGCPLLSKIFTEEKFFKGSPLSSF